MILVDLELKSGLYLLVFTAMRACIGRMNIIPTIMMGKIPMELPAIHMMNRFMGTCLIGANATSQER